MKLKFEVAEGSAVYSYSSQNATLQEAVDLLQRENVISLSVVKMTPAQYLKNKPPLNSTEGGECS